LALIRIVGAAFADSEGWQSAFRTDVDHDSEVIGIGLEMAAQGGRCG
jgi:hypothetical protein